MVRKYGLETVTDEQIVDFALYQYRGYLEGFMKDRHRILPGNLIEIRYEDFVADRMPWLKAIYTTLDLGAFGAMAGVFQRYIKAVQAYEPNRFSDDPVLRERITEELDGAFEWQVSAFEFFDDGFKLHEAGFKRDRGRGLRLIGSWWLGHCSRL